MDILFLSQVVPYPLDAGPKVRSYYVLRYLAQKHRVTLVTFQRSGDSPDSLTHLESFCHAVHTVPLKRSRVRDAFHLARSFVSPEPFLILRDDLASMTHTVLALTASNHFDAIHADQLSMAHYARRVPNTFRVFDAHNAVWSLVDRLAQTESNPLKRAILRREAVHMRQHEAVTCADFDRIVTVTTEDAALLTFAHPPPRAPLLSIPICIDPTETAPLAFHPEASDLICIGSMFYPPNVDGVLWFANEVLPQVWHQCPDTRFYIVGTRPDPALRQLAEREPRCIVTGYVPDVGELLNRAAAFVVPLRAGGGMRVKILDTWSWGIPLVTTSIGGEGIDVRNNENLLVADSAAAFAAATLRLVQDRNLAQILARNGRSWVSAHYDWHRRYREWDAVYPK